MRIMITGGAGFIGAHLVEHLLKTTDHEILVVDKAWDTPRLDAACGNDGRVSQTIANLCEEFDFLDRPDGAPIDQIWHLAAQSHVDTSIREPAAAIHNNVMSTVHMLEWARQHPVEKFLYFSTDEVFGPAPDGVAFKEWDRYKSGNPYSASKAAGEEIALAYHNTYGVPVIISHCMNVFGERQDPEKFVPLVMNRVRKGEEVLIHADPTRTRPGSRRYIHARNVASAVLTIMEHGIIGEKYNIVGEQEVDNLTLAQRIAALMGLPLRARLVDFHSSRPGHDLRYALDGTALAALGWTPPVTFDDGLRRTVAWTLAHPEWLDRPVTER